jgi:biotin carboxyl carrier protein
MRTALRSGDPVIFLEHKRLVSTKGLVPSGEYLVPLGKAAIVRTGDDLTIVSCSYMLTLCLEAAEQLGEQGISCEVIDLRTIVPLDTDTITASVKKTGKLLTVDESFPMYSVGAEIGQMVMERAFDWLDAPVGRLHPDPVNNPFSPAMEAVTFISVEKIVDAARAVVNGKPIVPMSVTACGTDTLATPGAFISSPVAARNGAVVSTAQSPGIPLILPNQDLTITDATIARWLKQVGDAVAEDEPVLIMETDKAAVEVESPVGGILTEILVTEGATVDLGTRIGTIRPVPR